MKRKWLIPLLALGVPALLALLALLLKSVEASAPGAGITSYGAALWYLLTTLTTVGYGDLYPVTAAGRWIGALLQMMSLGVLAALVGMLAAVLRSDALPRLRLRALRGREWLVFSERSQAADCLAHALRERRGCAILFCVPGSTGKKNGDGYEVPFTPEELCRRAAGQGLRLFCVGADYCENERLAADCAGASRQVFCMSDAAPDRVPEGLVYFDPAVCCARRYWDRFPLTESSGTLVLIGSGARAEALLEQGLLRNVLDPAQTLDYVVFGDFADFRSCRPRLAQLAPETPAPGRDSLRFSDAPWSADPALLQSASRVILCCADETETRRCLLRLRRSFPLQGTVYACLSRPTEGAVCFGTAQELYAPELVMREALSRRAMALHARYRAEHPAAPAWGELSDFLRRSNLASADHLSVKARILLGPDTPAEPGPEHWAEAARRFAALDTAQRERCRAVEHLRWLRFHWLNNWRFGPVRDNARRIHPLLVPYEELSPEEREKDDYSWELLAVLAKERELQ